MTPSTLHTKWSQLHGQCKRQYADIIQETCRNGDVTPFPGNIAVPVRQKEGQRLSLSRRSHVDIYLLGVTSVTSLETPLPIPRPDVTPVSVTQCNLCDEGGNEE